MFTPNNLNMAAGKYTSPGGKSNQKSLYGLPPIYTRQALFTYSASSPKMM